MAQNYDWWNTKHQWDSTKHWTQYLKLSPQFMGPNALPLPEIKTGVINQKLSFANSGEFHYSKGHQTYNLYQHLFIPVVSGRIGIESYIVPIEYYQTDTIARDRMMSRDKDGNGIAGGDFYFGTHLQLAKEHGNIPAILLTLNFKTASGTTLKAARFTDTPGYFFDVSAGKTLSSASANWVHRLFGSIGFYSFQTYDYKHLQDDLLTYGLGYLCSNATIEVKSAIGGYYGYINNGDRSIVARLSCKTTFSKTINYQLQLQQGLQDFPYSSIRLGIIWAPRFQLFPE